MSQSPESSIVPRASPAYQAARENYLITAAHEYRTSGTYAMLLCLAAWAFTLYLYFWHPTPVAWVVVAVAIISGFASLWCFKRSRDYTT